MPNSLKDQILESVDIVDVVGERVALTRKGRDYVGLCPFHNDHKPSLAVSPQKQIFKCWSCGVGGDAIKFVQLSQRVEFREALAILAKRAGIEFGSQRGDDRSARMREEIRRVLAWARAHFRRNLANTPAGRHAADYARQRGMTDATIERFGLGYAADGWSDLLDQAARANIARELLAQAGLIATNEKGKTYDRFRNRLVFPINDGLGRCVAFGGRTLGGDPAKYLNSPETPLFSKSRILYGLDVARTAISAARRAVVVEGYIDAVLLSQGGITNVVATLGTALTDAHVKLLSTLSDEVVMCFDSDEAGLRAADRAVETALRHRIRVKVALMPAGEDPADCVTGRGPDAVADLLQRAGDALEFSWKRTVEAFGKGEKQGQRDAVEAFLRFVARVTQMGGIDPLDQGLLIGRLGELLSLPAGTVYGLLTKAKKAAARESSSPTPDTSESSAYDVSISRLPPGLISAVEEAFGLALSAPESWNPLRESLAAGAAQCAYWKRLHAIMEVLVAESGMYNMADVMERCDDSAACDLVSRATARIGSQPVTPEVFAAVGGRIRSELEVLRIGGLRGEMRAREAPADERAQAYRHACQALREVVTRPQPGLLAVGQRGQGVQ